MEYLLTVIFKIGEFIDSKKAHAISITLIGFFLSVLLFYQIPNIFQVIYFIYPDFQQYVFNHKMLFIISYFAITLSPSIICMNITYRWLNLIYQQEARRYL